MHNGAIAHETRVLAWSDEELYVLSQIDYSDMRQPGISIPEHEMRCQRDMRVRGKRLTAYHARLGDLADFLPIAA